MLGSATADLPLHNHRVPLALAQAERFGLDLVIPWLQARLDYVKGQATAGHYIHPHLEELEPLLHARRRRAAAKRELNRLLDELEGGASGGYRLGLEDAVRWLGTDSSELTHRINQWARAGGGKLDLAFAFLASASWPVFTERAYALLDARPNDPQVREALLRGRDPFSSFGFIGDLSRLTAPPLTSTGVGRTHVTDASVSLAKRPSRCMNDGPANKRRTNDASESAYR